MYFITQYQKYETTIFFENFILPLHTPNYEKIQKNQILGQCVNPASSISISNAF